MTFNPITDVRLTSFCLVANIQVVPLLTFGSPCIAARNLPWGTEDPPSTASAIARASRLRPPLTQHWRVVVVRGHLTAGRLVGVAGGAALAKAVGLLSSWQLRTPAECGGVAREEEEVEV